MYNKVNELQHKWNNYSRFEKNIATNWAKMWVFISIYDTECADNLKILWANDINIELYIGPMERIYIEIMLGTIRESPKWVAIQESTLRV